MERAIEELILSNLGLVRYLANKYVKSSSLPIEDLIQEGSEGLIRAAKKFDPTRGTKFSTYATIWIRQAILAAMTEKSRVIKLPNNIVQLKLRMYKFQEKFYSMYGLQPDEAMVANALGEPIHLVRQANRLTTENTGAWETIDEDESIEHLLEIEERDKKVIANTKLLSIREQIVVALRFGLFKHL